MYGNEHTSLPVFIQETWLEFLPLMLILCIAFGQIIILIEVLAIITKAFQGFYKVNMN